MFIIIIAILDKMLCPMIAIASLFPIPMSVSSGNKSKNMVFF
jgi:hypothetical protein